MSIQGINGYKVSTVAPTQPKGDAVQTTDTTDDIGGLFDNPLLDGSTTPETSGSGTVLDQYMVGSDPIADDAGGATWLQDFPPTLEEIIAGNENAINYLDIVVQRYEKALNDLASLKQTYKQSQQSGQLTDTEAATISERLTLIENAMARCSVEIDKCTAKASDQEKLYLEEFRSMKDLDNNGWIGRVATKGSLYIKTDDEGFPVYYDWSTKRAIPCPIRDPDYQAEIFKGDGLVQCTDSPNGQKSEQITDMYMQLTNEAFQTAGSNTFGCPIDIGVPEYFWVEKDPNGTGEQNWKYVRDDKNCEEKMKIYDQWESSGLKQKVPEDRSRYVQVKVTNVTVRSESYGMTDKDGNPLYTTIIEFKNDANVICRIQIEGFEPEAGTTNPCATETNIGDETKQFVSASTAGIAFHDADRASPLVVDASQYKSTGRHVFDPIQDDSFNIIQGPQNQRGTRAFVENMSAFSKQHSYYEWNNAPPTQGGQTWGDAPKQKDFDSSSDPNCYGSFSDRYVSASESAHLDQIDKGCSDGPRNFQTYRTGIFLKGLRGEITGSQYNDMIMTRGVNDYSEYAVNHLPKKLRELSQGDELYNNFIDGTGGNDVVIAGQGNNFIKNSTMVWIHDSLSNDQNYVSFPETPTASKNSGNQKASPNQKNFFHSDGGSNVVAMPIEANISEDTAGNNTNDATKNDGSYEDDWYEVLSGSVEYGISGDTDLDVADSMHTHNQAFTATRVEDAIKDYKEGFLDAINEVPTQDEEADSINWDDVEGQQNELNSEMNSFFDEMFGENEEVETIPGTSSSESVSGF